MFESRNLRHRGDLFLQPAFQFFSGDLQIIVGLEVNPTLRVCAKKSGKPESRVRRNCSFSRNNLADPVLWDPNGFGKSILTDPERIQEIPERNLSRMNRRHISFHILPFRSGNQ